MAEMNDKRKHINNVIILNFRRLALSIGLYSFSTGAVIDNDMMQLISIISNAKMFTGVYLDSTATMRNVNKDDNVHLK